MDVLAEAVQAGKIWAVGVSNYSAALMRQAHARLARYNIPLASNRCIIACCIASQRLTGCWMPAAI
jgi:aryl-alcohol dehydrogenase-like predicted oxidoreductase